MKQLNSYLMTFRNIALVLCFLFLAFNAAQAQTANRKPWTTVGSTGTADKKDLDKISFDHSKVQMGQVSGGNAPPATAGFPQNQSAVIRYNITVVDGLLLTRPPAIKMDLRYLAAGGGFLVAKLIEVNLQTGVERTLVTFNSSGSTDNYRAGSARSRCFEVFDFATRAYYIEATLTASTILGGSAAGIQTIKVSKGNCIFLPKVN